MNSANQSEKNCQCPLCKGKGSFFHYKDKRTYYECDRCKGIFIHPEQIASYQKEKARYQEHNNNINDKGYQKFVSPITQAILNDFSPHHRGLDYGAGTAPVITALLRKEKYDIRDYDPFFNPDKALLNQSYDYIVCCEVIEHFKFPDIEFKALLNILNHNGKLYCMTHLYNSSIDFSHWYYSNDFTHVFIYQAETIRYIQQFFGFADVQVEERLIVFSR